MNLNLDLLAFLSPLIGVLVFFSVESVFLRHHTTVKNRIGTISGIEAFNLVMSVLLSTVVLVPLVYLLAPLQIFSFSNLAVPRVISFLLSFLFLDFINYLQHRLHHQIPFLWKLHRLHHSDRHMDALTAWLHHPLEVFSAFLFTVSFAVIFDVPVVVMVTYALVAGLHAPFTHLKTLLPARINTYLQYIFITPNVHRVHHALHMKEGNSNFGGIFIFWDLLFKTLLLKNSDYLSQMPLGIDNRQQPDKIGFSTYLKNPFI